MMIRKAIVTSPKVDATEPPAAGEAIAALASNQERAQPGGTAADQIAERADEIVDQDGPGKPVEQPAAAQPAAEKPAVEMQPATEESTTGDPADDDPADDDPANDEPADVEPADEEPAEDQRDAAEQDTLVEVPKTEDIPGALEALLLLAEEPMSETVLAQAVGAPVHVVADALAELVAFYDETGRGFELRQLGGGWRYYTRAEHADLIAGHVLDGAQSRLSQAALETLSVIAYLQPLSRSRVSAIRGVNVDGVIRTLLARGLIVEAGADAETGAVVFSTTDYFLERMGLSSLDQLPELAPHLPEASDLEAELSQFATISQAAESEPEPAEAVPPAADAAPALIESAPETAAEDSESTDAPQPPVSAASPVSGSSPDSPESPASPDSPESPASPGSPKSPDPIDPDPIDPVPSDPDPIDPEPIDQPAEASATAATERPVDPTARQDALDE